VATVAALQARAGGGEGSGPILAAYDPVLVTRRTGRRMKSRAHDEVRDGPPNKFVGISPNALVREGNGGEIASSVPAEVRVQNGHSGTWIGMSVPAEVRIQTGHSGTWIAMSVPAEIVVQTGHSGKGVASSVPAEVRARAQSAYKEAYTRAYRAYQKWVAAFENNQADGTSSCRPAAGSPVEVTPAGVSTCPDPCGAQTTKAYSIEVTVDEIAPCPGDCAGCVGTHRVTTYTCVDFQVCATTPTTRGTCRDKTVTEWDCCPCNQCSPCQWSSTTWGTSYAYTKWTLCVPVEC
jgi:hypothetical protein